MGVANLIDRPALSLMPQWRKCMCWTKDWGLCPVDI